MTSKYGLLAKIAIATAMFGVAGTGGASAYVGQSFLQIPGLAGGWQGEKYKDWVKLEAHYWDGVSVGFGASGAANSRRTVNAQRGAGQQAAAGNNASRNNRMGGRHAGPYAPREGASLMVVSVDKRSPALPKLMEACTSKAKIAEVSYAEAFAYNQLGAKGPRPDTLPEYFEYKLKDVTLDCPVLAEAPEQAFVVNFNDIQWLNYQGQGEDVKWAPKKLQQTKLTGATKAFVIYWYGVAHDPSDDQCPVMNKKPPLEEYYALLSKADAAKERTELGEKGLGYENGQMERRGPGKLNACKLPGILPDPGHFAPQPKFARGIDLDGNDGSGAPAAGTCKHINYVSTDGKQSGIDNQLFTVEGCMQGYQGHKGFMDQYLNENRRNGGLAMMVEISGIEDEKNDDSIEVAFLYSLDPMAKDALGTKILPDFTFRLTENPAFTHYVTQLKGKIVDGVITTEPVKEFQMNPGIGSELTLWNASVRFEIMADGQLKGVVGGYQDWRRRMISHSDSNQEMLNGFTCPGVYNALKRAADGMKDPVTGECNGISAAYDIEGVPAFIPPGQRKALIAQVQ